MLNVDTSDAKSNTTYRLQLKRNGETVEEEYKFLPRRNKAFEALSMKDAIYLLMPDRFAITDSKHCLKRNVIDENNPVCWHGGTLEGMKAHIGDIADMGFTAIWHTPVFENKQEVTMVRNTIVIMVMPLLISMKLILISVTLVITVTLLMLRIRKV